MATPIPENKAPFTLDEVLEATRGRVAFSGQMSACGVTTDTRALKEGHLFVALSGERFDAHAFVQSACDAGAAILVLEDRAESESLIRTLQGAPSPLAPSVVIVPDSLRALGDLAAHHRRRFDVRVAAVVGSAGKTTTRSVLSALAWQLAGARVLSTQGNLNNRIGVPMTLLGLEEVHDYAVLELGTNCPGEIAALGEIVAPDVAVLTLIDLEHTEGLSDLDGVEDEEGAIFRYLDPLGWAVGYGEDMRVRRQIESCPRHVSYGEEDGRDLRILARELISPEVVRLSLQRSDGSKLEFRSSLIGKAGALAAAAGVAAVEALCRARLNDLQCGRALSRVGEPGRHSLVRLQGPRFVVDDSYNSNPASVENSLRTGLEIAASTGGRLWIVLGEMLELGALSLQEHRKMGEQVARTQVAGAYFVQGDAVEAYRICQSQSSFPCRFFAQSNLVTAELASLVQPRDVVVVKASRGVRAERVVEDLTAFFGVDTSSTLSAS